MNDNELLKKMLDWADKLLVKREEELIKAKRLFDEVHEDYKSIRKRNPTKRAIKKYYDWLAMQTKK